ncbi:MAG: efflux transporter outer membrane subunit [Candidatus Hydrogenedentes bacterium]|nr:efflux transporter outer membrane subunit [Candidatus Hydrogenedentota bacterium]
MKMRWYARLFSPTLVLLGGCVVGPDYARPEVPLGVEQPGVAETAPVTYEAPATDWWQILDDPMLEGYIERTVASNLQLQIVAARVREARALRGIAAANFYPQVSLRATAQHRVDSEETGLGGGSLPFLNFGPERERNLFDVSFDAGWEIDFFGGTQRRVEAADARVTALEENARDVIISLIAEVARNYLELRGTQRQIALAEQNVALLQDAHRLVSAQYEAGAVGDFEVARSDAETLATEAMIPNLRAEVYASAYRLAVLMGAPPETLLDELLNATPLPAPPDRVPVGLRSDLLLRRPDLRRAERELAAATAAIGVATADLYPHISLTGTAGLQAAQFGDLFRSSAGAWSIGPAIRWPLLQGGRVQANIEAAQARADAAYLAYQQAVLAALDEVEAALVRYGEELNTRGKLEAAAAAQHRVLDLAQTRYDEGATEYFTVLDAQRQVIALDTRLAESETRSMLRLVAVYKALGGGWEPFAPEPAAMSYGPGQNPSSVAGDASGQ